MKMSFKNHKEDFDFTGLSSDLAVDIACDTATRPIILKSLRKAGFKRIGKARAFIHADVDSDKAQTESITPA